MRQPSRGSWYLWSVRLRRAAIIAALACLCACSLIVSTAGLAGDPQGPVDREGGLGNSDGPTDSMPSTPEAGDGSSFDAEGGKSSPCGVPHLFCDDFDDGPLDPGARWTTTTSEAGPLGFDMGLFTSSPRSLRMQVQPGAGVRRTEIRKALPSTPASLRIDLDMRSDGPSTSTYDEYDPIEIGLYPPPAGTTYHAITIAMNPGGAALTYYSNLPDGAVPFRVRPFTFPFRRWVHVTINATFTTSRPRTTLALDGIEVADVTLDGTTLTRADVALGAPYTKDAKVSWTFLFDNLVAD